jgi:hypothetical protein
MDKQICSPFDLHDPSPSEQLLGLCHGILTAQPDAKVAFQALKIWLVTHLPQESLDKMETCDPLWTPWVDDSCNESVDEPAHFYNEWAQRMKAGRTLPPLPGAAYKHRLMLLRDADSSA